MIAFLAYKQLLTSTVRLYVLLIVNAALNIDQVFVKYILKQSYILFEIGLFANFV